MEKRKIISILIAAVMIAQGITPAMATDLEAEVFSKDEINESASELNFEENAPYYLPEEIIMDSLPVAEETIPSEDLEEDLSDGDLDEVVLEEDVFTGEDLQEETDFLLYVSENQEFIETVPDLQMAEPESVSSVEDIQDDAENDNADLTGVSSGRCGDNLQWRINDEVLTIYGSGDMWDYAWFDDEENIAPWRNLSFKSVVVEDGVTSIGRCAFVFSGIENITLGADVKKIGIDAFGECSNLQSVVLNGKLEKIESGAFYSCIALETINMPDGVSYIGAAAFMGCSSIKDINIPKGTTDIQPKAFEGCACLKSVEIPSTVNAIGYWAFRDCEGLSEIHFLGSAPDFYVDREKGVFVSGCFEEVTANVYYPGDDATWLSYIDSVELGSELTWTPVGAVKGECGDNLTWTLTDDGVLTISGTGEMYDYKSSFDPPWRSDPALVKSIIIESGVTSICAYAFENCESLTSVTIPDSITSIGDYAFNWCGSLTEISVSANNDTYLSVDGVLFNKNQSMLVCVPGRKTGAYVIPDSVTSIGNGALSCCASLTSVTIPDSVTSIGNWAFNSCSSLTSVTIPNSVLSIGDAAFNDCYSLMSMTIPDSVTSIGGSAFFECTSLTSVTIPDSVTSIGNWAFYYCVSLTSVTIPDSLTSIGYMTFAFCRSLTNITIPDSIMSIGDSAFYASGVKNVTIPSSVTSIGDRAFVCGLDIITFEGDAVEFIFDQRFDEHSSVFDGVTAVAYYPAENPTWTADVRQNYGGNITWIPLRSNGKECFSDVTDPSQFFYDSIYWAVDNDITTGFKDNTFRPNNNCNRAAVVTFLWRLAGKPNMGITTAFSDMTGNDDFDHAITWAAVKGITTGFKDGTFRPWATCNRASIVTFIWRYAGRPEPTTMAGFSDMTDNPDFNKAISWAAQNGITTGYKDGTFRPWNQCARLAVVSFLYRYNNLLP